MKEKNVKQDYGPLEAVPMSERHVGFWDSVATFAGATLQPTTWTLGGTMICLGVFSGILTTTIATLISYTFIALFALMTFYSGTSTAGMARFVLGIRGSSIFSISSIINSLGWSIVSNYMAAITYSYVFQLIFHTPAYGEAGCELYMIIGCLLNAILSYLAVGIGGTRLMKVFERFMMIALVIFSVVLFYILLKGLSWNDVLSFVVPDEMKMSFFGGLDFLLAVTITFAVLGGDLGRSMKTTTTAKYTPIIGGVAAMLCFVIMGMCGIILHFKTTGEFNIDVANPSTLAMSMGLGIVALLVVLFATVTTNMIDVFAMTNNIENLWPSLGFSKSALFAGLLPILFCWLPVAVSSFFDVFYSFADFLGALFPPILVIILMDFFVIRKKNVDMHDIDSPDGKYWYSGGYNVTAIVIWAIGSVIFFIMHIVLGFDFFSNVILSMVIVAVLYYIAATNSVKKGYYQ
ncbi:MAG: cytosine permease [Lachnospiraceae bacterium]|nr:cytosine permease [Lachnospiraceae bacterium]